MEQYFFSTREGEAKGPVSTAELRDKQACGLLPQQTRICREGTTIWRRLTPLQPAPSPEPSSRRQTLALGGSALLFVGVFCPIVSIPIVGQMNYFQNGRGDGTIILVLAIASAVLALGKQFRMLWFTGGGSLGLLVFTFVRFQSGISHAKRQMQSDLRGNPFAGFADLAMQSVQLQWGLTILVIGAVLVIAAAVVRPVTRGSSAWQPPCAEKVTSPSATQLPVSLQPYEDPFEKWQQEQNAKQAAAAPPA